VYLFYSLFSVHRVLLIGPSKIVADTPSFIKPKGSRTWRLELDEETIFALDDLLDKFLNEHHETNPDWFHGMDMENLNKSHKKVMALIQHRIDRGEL